MEFGSRDAFDRMGTLGIEEEFFIVDAEGRPTSGTDDLVYASEPPAEIPNGFDHELFQCTIEAQTPLLEGYTEAEGALTTVREALVSHADAHGYRIASAGLHPDATWRELDHAQKPRYRSQLDRIRYPQHRNTTAGLHVHVGVDDADKAIWIANELRWYCPVLLALSANSPFWNGFDTGLSSARAKIFENLPNTGVPSAFEDFEAFERYERRMVEHGSIEDRGELWFDVRPHTGHGTVEVRAPDAQRDPELTLAFAECVHALVVDLAERYQDGEPATRMRRELLDENKWRAIRHGHGASFITRDGKETVSLATAVDRLCDRLGVSGLRGVLDRESGAERQRRIHADEGPEALRADLIVRP
ncbi:glutamate--cysteine ligase [Halorubrum vacuolatum]|uniref:Glutamate--cysteine ligase n=1 Tax=Halorubrum vacuolatum TaxID=63740 RepID=A0A238WJK6_HALVU|nr:glutamate--cysteine ligase [Halorubrum vacuolatum]SNR46511.1 carboxylate-amine ligase [Halorubrum vacuolatum]